MLAQGISGTIKWTLLVNFNKIGTVLLKIYGVVKKISNNYWVKMRLEIFILVIFVKLQVNEL